MYVFKQGFGGAAMRFLETHDLVYQPLIYSVYMRLLDIKRKRDERRYARTTEKANATTNATKRGLETNAQALSR